MAAALFIYFFGASALAMSDQAELSIGRAVDVKIRKHYGVFEDSQIQKYIEHVGTKIVSVSDRQDIVYHFAVLNTDAINSLGVAGGYVYITRGMLAEIESEAELAAALASEIVHISRRHGINRIERAMKFDENFNKITDRSRAFLRAVNTAYNFVKAGYGKKLQTEADIKGAEYLLRAGYDTDAMIKLFDMVQVQEKKNPGLVLDLVKMHYKTTKRIDAVKLMQNNLKAVDANKYNSVSGNFYAEKYRKNVLYILDAGGNG